MEAADILPLRTRYNLTQRQLATLLDVDPITVSRWERNVQPVSQRLSKRILTQVAKLERKASR